MLGIFVASVSQMTYIEVPGEGIDDLICANMLVDENVIPAFDVYGIHVFRCMLASQPSGSGRRSQAILQEVLKKGSA